LYAGSSAILDHFLLETARCPPIYKRSGQTGLHSHHVCAWWYDTRSPVYNHQSVQAKTNVNTIVTGTVKRSWLTQIVGLLIY